MTVCLVFGGILKKISTKSWLDIHFKLEKLKSIDMFLRTDTIKIATRHQSRQLEPCGVRNRNAKERYLEILNFQHFAKFTTFTTDGEDFRNKVLKNKIDVSVVLDLECVDMFTQFYE